MSSDATGPLDKGRYVESRPDLIGFTAEPYRSLDDPTTVIVTDGSPEAEAAVLRARLQAARESEQGDTR